MKILIVNNNMKVGGVQKSLCNLLWELERQGEHDVTLLLFSPVGDYMGMLPPGIKCITTKSLFRYLGISQGETRGVDRLKRGALAAICRLFGRSAAIRLMLVGQNNLHETYDCAIAYLHNGDKKAFGGGVQEFVLERVTAKQKIAFVHGDYGQNGAKHPANDALMAQFDAIAACSDGCAAALSSTLPELTDRIVTVRNCHNITQIQNLAEEDAVSYDCECINIVCVARLSATKGIDRAVRAVANALQQKLPVALHIVGSGPVEGQLKGLVEELGICEHVHFYGEQANPYRYMKAADLLLLTSYHEAAPMVIDEAYILGLPTLTTKTSSSEEMVSRRNCGWVCENNQQDLNRMLLQVLRDPENLRNLKENLRSVQVSNAVAMEQFANVVKR